MRRPQKRLLEQPDIVRRRGGAGLPPPPTVVPGGVNPRSPPRVFFWGGASVRAAPFLFGAHLRTPASLCSSVVN